MSFETFSVIEVAKIREALFTEELSVLWHCRLVKESYQDLDYLHQLYCEFKAGATSITFGRETIFVNSESPWTSCSPSVARGRDGE